MLAILPVHLLVLTFASYVSAAASLTPPQVSASDTSGSLSLSLTPTSSAKASGSSSASGNVSSTATSSAQFPSLSGLSDCGEC